MIFPDTLSSINEIPLQNMQNKKARKRKNNDPRYDEPCTNSPRNIRNKIGKNYSKKNMQTKRIDKREKTNKINKVKE